MGRPTVYKEVQAQRNASPVLLFAPLRRPQPLGFDASSRPRSDPAPTNPQAMGKEESTDERPQKAPCLEPTDSECLAWFRWGRRRRRTSVRRTIDDEGMKPCFTCCCSLDSSAASLGSDGFFLLVPEAMGKEESTDERPQKAPRLESTDSGCLAWIRWGRRRSVRRTQVVVKPCNHFLDVADQVESLVAMIKSRNQAPMCETCWLDTFKGTTSGWVSSEPRAPIMVCLECMRCLCAGVVGVGVTRSNPSGHAWYHAHKKCHWVALWFDRPYEAFCFSCGSLFSIQSGRQNESGAHASPPDTDELCHVIRGIPNCGYTCYVNALVQCLLALDELRKWMLGPNAPMGSLYEALKELFEETTPGNDAKANLNPKKLLASLGVLNERYAAGTMEDSQELLLDLCKGLHEAQKLQWPPKVRDRYRTAVESIFQGQASNTLTCKSCLFTSSPSLVPFSELSLPLPSKGKTTKSVDSPQRSLAIDEGDLKRVQTDGMGKDKPPVSLETDSTKAKQVWQTENGVHGFLQTQEDKISYSVPEVIAVPQKSSRFGDLSSQQEILVQTKENADSTIAEQLWKMDHDEHGFLRTQEDKISYTKLLREVIEEPQKSAHADDLSSQQEIAVRENVLERSLIEAKENISTVQVTPDDKGKALSKNFIHGDEEDSNSLASIEHYLALYFKVEVVEWRCDKCGKVSEKAGTGSPVESDCDGKAKKRIEMSNVEDSQNASTPPNRTELFDLNIAYKSSEDQIEQEDNCGKVSEKAGTGSPVESDCDGKAEKRIEMSNVEYSQNASTPPNRTEQIDLNIAYKLSEDQIEPEDRKGYADKTLAISKLPPVLTVHLKRFERVNNEQVKVPGHVSFGENLDVGQFMDPRSEDKDKSRYRLRGVIEHIGNSLNVGHNVAYVRVNKIGSDSYLWFRASDNRIKKVSLEEVLKCEAFVLFYERMEG